MNSSPRTGGYIYIWVYEVAPEHDDAFVHAYGPNGQWSALFDDAPGYIRTELHRDRHNPHRYVTIDYWQSAQAWDTCRADNAALFEAIDERCERLTVSETEIGRFDRV